MEQKDMRDNDKYMDKQYLMDYPTDPDLKTEFP